MSDTELDVVREYLEKKYKLGEYEDSDGDGMPDSWETSHFGGTNIQNGAATEDWDRDGVNNLDEYIADTSPTNGADLFQIFFESASDIRWFGSANRVYSLYGTTNLSEGAWVVITNCSGTNGLMSISSMGETGTGRFFKLQTQVP
jgi:hypothetical protein